MNQTRWGLPRCPYCGKKLGFWEAWLLRTKGEYLCPKCGSVSNIKFQKTTYGMAAIVSILGLGILLLSTLLIQNHSLWGIPLVLFPFLLFVFLSPCWMVLEAFQPAGNRPRPSGLRETPGSNGFSSGNTQVIPAIRKNPAPRGTYPAPTAGGRPSQRPSGPPPYSPRQGGVRPSVMRETPPVQDARPQRPFVPPQKKQSAPPTDNREGRDGFSGRPPRP